MCALSLSKKKKEPKLKKEPKPPKEKKAKVVKEQASARPGTKTAKKVVPPDKYTLLLLLAWLVMIAACVMMYLDLISYQK